MNIPQDLKETLQALREPNISHEERVQLQCKALNMGATFDQVRVATRVGRSYAAPHKGRSHNFSTASNPPLPARVRELLGR